MLPDYLKDGSMCIKDIDDFRKAVGEEFLNIELNFSEMYKGVLHYKRTLSDETMHDTEILVCCSMDFMGSLTYSNVETIGSILLDSDNINIYYNEALILKI